MGACRYGISLQVFTHTSWVRCQVEHKKRIPYLQPNMYYFVYHINTIALFQQEKLTSLMNEKKWINKHWITIVQCISANSQDGKMHWVMIIKNNSGHNFQLKKF